MSIRLKASTIKNMRGQTDLFQNLAKEHQVENIETIRRWVRLNKVNGPLTTLASLRLISDALGQPVEQLTEDKNNGPINEGVRSTDTVVKGHDSKANRKLS